MKTAFVVILTTLTGCSAIRERAGEYAQEVAIEQVERAIDKQLEKRGLSLEQLRHLADQDMNGRVDQGEIVRLARSSLADFVDLKVQLEADKAQAGLEEKLKALAGAKDVDELKKIAQEQDVFGGNTRWGLAALLLGYLGKQVFSAKSDGKRDERIAVLEQVSGVDLNQDGRIGSTQPLTPAAPRPAGPTV